MKMFYLLCALFLNTLDATNHPPHLTIVTCSFNNALFAEHNIRSVAVQNGPPFRFIYVDDYSTDATADIVKKSLKQLPSKITAHFIQNTSRQGALANLYTAIHTLPPEEVVLILDGDDFLAHAEVVNILLSYYQKGAWLTYGSYLDFPQMSWGPFSCPLPEQTLKEGLVRSLPWVASAPRSFYAGLFHNIKKSDLQEDGAFLRVTYDAAIMFPLMEMAQERAVFIPEPLYLYNTENILSDFQVQRENQFETFQRLQKLPRYPRLEKLSNYK